LIRAQRFRELGIIDILHPDDLEPAAITKWLQHNMKKKSSINVKIGMNGLTQITKSMESLFAEARLTTANYGVHWDR
jgi:predicted glycosyltransferase